MTTLSFGAYLILTDPAKKMGGTFKKAYDLLENTPDAFIFEWHSIWHAIFLNLFWRQKRRLNGQTDRLLDRLTNGKLAKHKRNVVAVLRPVMAYVNRLLLPWLQSKWFIIEVRAPCINYCFTKKIYILSQSILTAAFVLKADLQLPRTPTARHINLEISAAQPMTTR